MGKMNFFFNKKIYEIFRTLDSFVKFKKSIKRYKVLDILQNNSFIDHIII